MSFLEVRLTVTKLVSKLGFRKAIFGKSLENHSNGSVNGLNGFILNGFTVNGSSGWGLVI